MFSQWSDNNPNYPINNNNQYNPIHYYNNFYFHRQCILNHLTTILETNPNNPNNPYIHILTHTNNPNNNPIQSDTLIRSYSQF
jgi:hypothetical protein